MPSIGRLALQITANTAGVDKGVMHTEQSIRGLGQTAGHASRQVMDHAEQIGHSHQHSARHIRHMGHAIHLSSEAFASLFHAEDKALNALSGFATAGIFFGSGMWLYGAIFALKEIVGLLHHKDEQLDKLQDTALKAFGTIVDGSKTAAQAIAEVRVTVLTESINALAKDVVKNVDDVQSLADRFGLSFEQVGQLAVGGIIQRMAIAQQIIETLKNDPFFQWLMRFAEIERLRRDVTNLHERVSREGRTAGMTPEEAERAELANRGVNQAFLDQIGRVQDANRVMGQYRTMLRSTEEQLNSTGNVLEDLARKLEALGKIEEAAGIRVRGAVLGIMHIYEQTRSPMESFNDRMNELNRLWDTGMLSADLYDRALSQAFNTLDRAASIGERARPGALGAGTQAAFSAINQAQREAAGGGTAQERLAQIAAQEAQRNEQQRRDIADLARIAREQPRLGKAR